MVTDSDNRSIDEIAEAGYTKCMSYEYFVGVPSVVLQLQ